MSKASRCRQIFHGEKRDCNRQINFGMLKKAKEKKKEKRKKEKKKKQTMKITFISNTQETSVVKQPE